MSYPIRILAVTMTACGCLFLAGPAHAVGRDGDDHLVQPSPRRPHLRLHPKQAADELPSRKEPRAKPEAEKPSTPSGKPSGSESTPDEDEEVSPGDSPTSCDGCELAGFALGGSLWGLFGIRRRRGTTRTVIRGFQPR
jgi:hypothetical protein